MSAVPVPMTVLQALADETLRRLELAPQIEHPGESSRAREQMLIAFIEQLIPSYTDDNLQAPYGLFARCARMG